MNFYGCYFTYNGKSCQDFDLALYEIGNGSDDSFEFPSVGKALMEWIPTKSKAFYYGLQKNEPMTFDLTFGIDPTNNDVSIDNCLKRIDIQKIADWLTGYTDGYYNILTIDQEDMQSFEFHCYISNLRLNSYSRYPLSFSCTVTCDSPYAYQVDENVITWESAGTANNYIMVPAICKIHEGYMPKMQIIPHTEGDISILKLGVGEKPFLINSFSGMANNCIISVDNDTKVIECNKPINIYKYVGDNYIKLHPLSNAFTLTGNFTLKWYLKYPVNIGG